MTMSSQSDLAEVFDKFLHGSTLEECYAAVASVANRWLDLLDNQGIDISDSELLDYISESSTMSKSLVDYGQQKSCSVTTAKRLADFLGDAMVKDKGLRCQYVVACKPQGTPVSERAIPVAIFETDAEISRFYLRKWCKISTNVGIRSIVDWSYYKQRLSSAIQKIITIPAAMQKVSNPVPRVIHPDWLHKKVRERADPFRQRKLDIYCRTKKVEAMQDNESIDDLEDIVNKESASRIGTQPIVRSYEVNKEKFSNMRSCPRTRNLDIEQQDLAVRKSDQPLMSLDENCASEETIDMNMDYQGLLEFKKRKWKATREERKRRRLGVMNISHQSTGAARLPASLLSYKPNQERNGVNSFFRKSEPNLMRSHWQIIQLVSCPQPGHFFAWVVADGIMVRVPVNVPRIFYLNSKASITEEFPGRRVNKILPHSRPRFNLIEVAIDEVQFRAESKKLAVHLADPEVEGIYETKVPLEFTAILQIGCVCKVDKTAKPRNIVDGWDLDELHMKTTTECSYLENNISFFYLYHSSSEERAIYTIYFPVSRTIFVVVINSKMKELSTSFLEKKFREACQALSMEHLRINSKVEYVESFDAGHKFLEETIIEFRLKHSRPAVGVLECPNIHAVKSAIQILDDFPCINIPCNAQDNNYQPLQWQVTAGKISMQRCAASSQWFNERIFLSRYAHVPLGNFELDCLLFTADVFFSRELRDQQQLLWISDDGIPDLGGVCEADICFADEVSQPSLANRGAYRRVAVELKIHHLAVNALLKSSQVDEMEGGTLFGYDNDMNSGHANETDFDEVSSCAPAFRVLKQLIQRCVLDVVESRNVFADKILLNLYQWLCSPQSKLHDPALHLFLHKVMKKVFALLLAEFQKLGATIIFANFSKIIIDTGKIDLPAASAYCDFLLETLQTRELFKWIGMEPVQYWHCLLFMDQYNYGGIQAKSPTGCTLEDIDDSQIGIVSSWNIAECLPKVTQDHFISVVSEFLYIPWKYSKEQVAMLTTMRDDSACTPVTVTSAEALEACVTEYLREQISSHFTEKLLKIVGNILHHFKGSKRTDIDGPVHNELLGLANSHVHKGDAALEFIKRVCVILALDQSVLNDILRMKRNLLKLVRVKEFAPEAQFHDSCPSVTLPNVICSYCNDYRDLDLCRDTALLRQEWRCAVPQCGQPYNREQMENSLLQIVWQLERLYHLQDLECLRCRKIKAAHLAEHCVCGGSFKCKEESSEFLTKMRVFLAIANRQRFQLLQDCTSWILEVR